MLTTTECVSRLCSLCYPILFSGLTTLCMTEKECPRVNAFRFITAAQDEFLRLYAGRWQKAAAYAYNNVSRSERSRRKRLAQRRGMESTRVPVFAAELAPLVPSPCALLSLSSRAARHGCCPSLCGSLAHRCLLRVLSAVVRISKPFWLV